MAVLAQLLAETGLNAFDALIHCFEAGLLMGERGQGSEGPGKWSGLQALGYFQGRTETPG